MKFQNVKVPNKLKEGDRWVRERFDGKASKAFVVISKFSAIYKDNQRLSLPIGTIYKIYIQALKRIVSLQLLLA